MAQYGVLTKNKKGSTKMFDYKAKYEELQAQYDEESAKYNTRLTREACLVIGGISFVLGFLAKAMIF